LFALANIVKWGRENRPRTCSGTVGTGPLSLVGYPGAGQWTCPHCPKQKIVNHDDPITGVLFLLPAVVCQNAVSLQNKSCRIAVK